MTLQRLSASYGHEETTRQKVTIDLSGTLGLSLSSRCLVRR
jgi:hypothetical protein